MRISDWSSDVCSSDLKGQPGVGPAGWPLLRPALMVAQGPERHGGAAGPILLCVAALLLRAGALEPLDDSTAEIAHSLEVGLHKIPDVIDPNQVEVERTWVTRNGVGWGKSVSVR